MRRFFHFRLFLMSVGAALILSLVSLYCLVRISDMVVEDYRYGYLMYIARQVEKSADHRPVEKVNVASYPAPALPKQDTFSLVKITEFGASTAPELPEETRPLLRRKKKKAPERSPHMSPNIWLVSDEGKILSSTNGAPLPMPWGKLPLPKKVHGIRSMENVLLHPKIYTVKLDTVPVTYLVSHNERSLFQGPFLWIQGVHTFATAALAVFLALSICFFWMRRKSKEARKVLHQLEAGDLKARFHVQRFDEFGNLIKDFNRMADEIERLVKRVNDTEATRSNLLQELGHDLRTPLTSLSTSFEALKEHNDVMEQEDRDELFSIVDADIRYFRELLDKLTIVATIDVPHYKASTERIDLATLLEDELKNRQAASSGDLTWKLDLDSTSKLSILGDYHLITRLFKNAFDNASRYAQSLVAVNLQVKGDEVEVTVSDDGPGLSPAQIQAFGKRRERRELKHRDAKNFSLGLGSVIMRTIAEVHDGTLAMESTPTGACLRIKFKKESLP